MTGVQTCALPISPIYVEFISLSLPYLANGCLTIRGECEDIVTVCGGETSGSIKMPAFRRSNRVIRVPQNGEALKRGFMSDGIDAVLKRIASTNYCTILSGHHKKQIDSRWRALRSRRR